MQARKLADFPVVTCSEDPQKEQGTDKGPPVNRR